MESSLYEPLTQRYRPRKLEELVGQDTALKIVSGMLSSRNLPRAILISGVYSSGKTTLARIIARYINCLSTDPSTIPCGICRSCMQFNQGSHQDLMEIDAASQRGIDDIRELNEVSRLAPSCNMRIFILDECYPGETLVLVDYDKAVSIQQIYEDKSITHVLAYDLENRKIVKKRITNRFARPYEDNMATVTVDDAYFECTRRQELYVEGKGYTPVDEILPSDQLIQYVGDYQAYMICPHCNELVPTISYPGHVMQNHRDKTSHVDYTDSRKGHVTPPETRRKISEGRQAWVRSPEGIAFAKRLSEERRGENNPVFRHMTPSEVSKKASKNQKAWWANMDPEERDRRIRTFINAPKHVNHPNHVEQAVIDFDITGLKFVGDGSLFMTLQAPDGPWRKNPDFVYKEEGKVRKIVEVMDLEYWHTLEEASLVQMLYKKIGYDCLIVDASRVYTDPDAVKGEIEAFCHNHSIPVQEISIARNRCKGRMVYDLEVEDAHNFFVVSKRSGRKLGPAVLSSNCHMLTNIAWRAFLKTLEEPPAKTIFILVTTRPNQLPETIISRCSPITLNAVKSSDTSELLLRIAQAEQIPIDAEAATLIAEAVDGHPRNALMLLEQASHYLHSQPDLTKILPQLVEQHLKLAPRDLIQMYTVRLANQDAISCIRLIQAVSDQQEDFLKSVIGHMLQMLFAVVSTPTVNVSDFAFKQFIDYSRREVPNMDPDKLIKQIKVLEHALERIRRHAPDPARILQIATLEALFIV